MIAEGMRMRNVRVWEFPRACLECIGILEVMSRGDVRAAVRRAGWRGAIWKDLAECVWIMSGFSVRAGEPRKNQDIFRICPGWRYRNGTGDTSRAVAVAPRPAVAAVAADRGGNRGR
jgi:hypothetical protein